MPCRERRETTTTNHSRCVCKKRLHDSQATTAAAARCQSDFLLVFLGVWTLHKSDAMPTAKANGHLSPHALVCCALSVAGLLHLVT